MILRWTAMVKVLISTSVLHIAVLSTCYAQQVPWRRASGTEGQSVSSIDVYRTNPDTLYGLHAINPSLFMRSIDRGEHWQSISVNGIYGPGPIRVDPRNSLIIYASIAGIGSGSDIAMTSDGGQNWRRLFIGGFNLTNVVEIDPMHHNTVYVGMGWNQIFRTKNQGQTWDTIMPPPAFWLTSMAIATTNDSVIYVGYSSTPSVFKSADGGSSWTSLPFISPLQAGPLLAVDPRNANIVYSAIYGQDTTQPGGVFKSTNGGISWIEKNTGLRKQDRRIHSIVLNPRRPDDIFIGLSNTSGNLVFRSTDRGEHWFGFSSGLPSLGGIGEIAIDTVNSRAYAVGGRHPDSAGIFILDDLTTEAIERLPEVPQRVTLLQNYPNPFNPSTRIGYRLIRYEFVILKVYTILGREVSTLVRGVKAPGEYQVTWNGSNCVSGIYFYRLETPAISIIRKMLLVR